MGLGRDDRFWPNTRQHAHTIVTTAAAIAGVYRLKPERRDGVLLEVRTPAWPQLFRHGSAAAMLEDSDDDGVFVRTSSVIATSARPCTTRRYPIRSGARKAARLRIAPETWR